MSTIPVYSTPVPITLSLTPGDFHRFGSDQFCVLEPGAISVPLEGQLYYDSRVTTDGQTVYIAPPAFLPLALEFLVQPAAIDPNPPSPLLTYTVKAVYFCGADGQAPGVYTCSPDRTGVAIQNVYNVVGNRPSNWEFAVIVEQVSVAPDGKTLTFVGVIDPPIDEKLQH